MIAAYLLLLTGLFSMNSHDSAAEPIETQLTHEPGGKVLTNIGVWTPDGKWLLYDTRSDTPFSPLDGKQIKMINVVTKEIKTIYEGQNGADCFVVTCNPKRPEAVFILGPEHPTEDWKYSFSHRQGAIVEIDHPGKKRDLDARDITAPFTPGALRGGSHVHVFSGDGEWVSFTYNDHLLMLNKPGADPDQRNIGVSAPIGKPVHVHKDSIRNHGSSYFTVLATHTVTHPKPGSDEIQRAVEEGWIGVNGYLRSDGTRQKRALAFQGEVVTTGGKVIPEVFVSDLPEDITVPSELGPLEGTETTRPMPPKGTVQRRLTYTADRKYPGIQGPRHWLRSSPDGTRIAFLMKDDDGFVQIWTVSPLGGSAPVQLTHDSWSVSSAISWSHDGHRIAYAADNSVFTVDTITGASKRLTKRSGDDDKPRPEACVFSPDDSQIAFMRNLKYGDAPNAPIFHQLFVVTAPK